MDAGLPCVEPLTLYVEEYLVAFGTLVIAGCPVVVGIYFGIEGELGQEEVDHRTGDAAIAVAFEVAVAVWQIGSYFLQLVEDMVEHHAPF